MRNRQLGRLWERERATAVDWMVEATAEVATVPRVLPIGKRWDFKYPT